MEKSKAPAQFIFVPAPGAGHLVSTIEFAKTLIQLDPQIFISLLVIKLPFTPFVDAYINSLAHSQPNIHLIHVPQADPPPSELADKSIESYVCAFIDSHKSLIHNIIQHIISDSHSTPVVGLILDLFCPSLIDIADEFGIPSFIFLTSGGAFLNLMFCLPSRHQQIAKEFSISDSEISIPGFRNPVPPKVLPHAVFNKDGGYEAYIQIAKGFHRVKGIIVNTFTELESYAIESYKKGNYPKVYPVGPVLNLRGHPNPEMDKSEWDKIMKWLDDQPESSVVFLCFGSAGSFDEKQLKEIAMGLEQSGHKFLWCIRFPEKQETETKKAHDMLPEGWLERVKGRGMISGWAPQVEVLGHKAIGGFVSHCGWNSILESLWYGVPIATLPIYAEQQLNAFSLVKELEMAVELKLDYRRNGEIGKEEVEKGVRSLMEDSENERNKVKDMSKLARMVHLEGGSSFNSLSQFIRDVTH
ncbi:anthocyanidin 3-O-glucosyltransferase 2-like [Euphorbia lathyris]|uniref:anthocyanidin 3-O-glucosyltransferase 2-like n=1 Tax=Euphorbia lathyris TaxID=212925 RepID=UPI003313142E